MSLPAISNFDSQELINLHALYDQKIKLTSYSIAAASFLVIGALIVITSGSLCLMLPGVNVLNDLVLPAIVPALFAILFSLPLMIKAVKEARNKKSVHKILIKKIFYLFDEYDVPRKSKNERTAFILKYCLLWPTNPEKPNKLLKKKIWMLDYQQKLLTTLLKKVGEKEEERNPRQKKIATAINRALMKLGKK